MKTILEQLLGTTYLAAYLAWFLLAFGGAFTAIIIRAKLKYKNSYDTPHRWSWSFLLQHNLLNLTIGFLIAVAFFRFSNLVLKIETSIWLAYSIGFISNEIAFSLMKFGLTPKK
ncbi:MULTISPECIES: hypothetical protein [unclassified Flavobacterium]|uniref:hypothetical protein n=1 Tax=unclassified Flavobacterium TaxID=196869 RepID=UPI00131B9FA7|nr:MULTISPECIES: hypothetical protein [unclassified Flavobacterium]